MKVITMCLWNRPQYTARVLAALSRCDGIADYLLLPHVEPGCLETRRMVESIDFCACRPRFNERRLKVNRNTIAALDDGFSHADFVIHVEEDVLLAPDALRYFEYCSDAYRSDPSVFSSTSYHKVKPRPDISRWHDLSRRRWYHCWGWATWSDRYAEVRGLLEQKAGCGATWDTTLMNDYFTPASLVEVYPVLSRSQNIGSVSSIHPATGFFTVAWHADNQHAPSWAGDVDVPPGDFLEPAEPGR